MNAVYSTGLRFDPTAGGPRVLNSDPAVTTQWFRFCASTDSRGSGVPADPGPADVDWLPFLPQTNDEYLDQGDFRLPAEYAGDGRVVVGGPAWAAACGMALVARSPSGYGTRGRSLVRPRAAIGVVASPELSAIGVDLYTGGQIASFSPAAFPAASASAKDMPLADPDQGPGTVIASPDPVAIPGRLGGDVYLFYFGAVAGDGGAPDPDVLLAHQASLLATLRQVYAGKCRLRVASSAGAFPEAGEGVEVLAVPGADFVGVFQQGNEGLDILADAIAFFRSA